MAEKSPIEWTDATWNPVTGCTLVSAGCKNCYAATLAATRLKNHPSRAGLARINAAGEAKFTGEVRLNEQWLDQPLRWRKPRRIFVCAHGDLFHESVPDDWIDRVFAIMALARQHTFQVLTKRPERARKYLARHDCSKPGDRITNSAFAMNRQVRGYSGSGGSAVWPLPNVWLGTSVEDQASADARIPHLLATPAAVRFVSAEPLLGPVDLDSTKGGTLWIGGQRGCGGAHQHSGRQGDVIHGVLHERDPRQLHHHHDDRCGSGLDLVIVGGESGPNARPMHPDWPRALRDQCVAAGVAFFFKQWGEYEANEIGPEDPRSLRHPPGHVIYRKVGKKAAGRKLEGRTWDEMPGARHG